MSYLINFEKNCTIELNVKAPSGTKNVEGPSLCVSLKSPELIIKPTCSFVLSTYDTDYLTVFLSKTTSKEFFSSDASMSYSDSGAVLELSVTGSHFDNMYSIEFWLNVASVTDGNKYGYDYGIRFAVKKDDYHRFANALLSSLRNQSKN